MIWWQQRSATTLPVLPSSNALWQSLWLQLLVELQQLARERRMTIIEMREFLLTHTVGLTMMEWCWLEQVRNLLAVMPWIPPDEEIWYDLSSYPPRIIHLPVARPPPSMLTSLTDLLPLTSMIPHQPPIGSSTSSEHITPLPPLHNLIRQILRLGLL